MKKFHSLSVDERVIKVEQLKNNYKLNISEKNDSDDDDDDNYDDGAVAVVFVVVITIC